MRHRKEIAEPVLILHPGESAQRTAPIRPDIRAINGEKTLPYHFHKFFPIPDSKSFRFFRWRHLPLGDSIMNTNPPRPVRRVVRGVGEVEEIEIPFARLVVVTLETVAIKESKDPGFVGAGRSNEAKENDPCEPFHGVAPVSVKRGVGVVIGEGRNFEIAPSGSRIYQSSP